MFSIFKLKRAKDLYGGYPTDFSRDRQKFQVAPQLLENIPQYTKDNKIYTNLYSIKQKIN
jgi:hypothetical protein